MHLPEESLNEYYHKLYQFQDDVLTLVDRSEVPFYLGGGTALSRFYFHHRYSNDLDFFTINKLELIDVVQEIRKKLEDRGYRISTHGFSSNFARLLIQEPQFSGVELKVDVIASGEDCHCGNFKSDPLFSRIDNPPNILAEKLCYIHKRFPKDIADIWVICQNEAFDWEEVITWAAKKKITDPLFIAETLHRFPATELERVLWIKPVNIDDFNRDRDIIIEDIISKQHNRLAGSACSCFP